MFTKQWLIVVGIILAFLIALGARYAVEEFQEITIVTDTLVLSQSDYRDHWVSREAERIGLPVVMALAVSHAENTRGIPDAISSAGAVGVMQVLRRKWENSWRDECYGDEDLTSVRRNACVGVRILQGYVEDSSNGNWNAGLRLYVGAAVNNASAGNEYVIQVMAKLRFSSP